MKESNDKISFRMAIAIMEQLVESGVKAIVASPGYRNSPLLLAAHQNPDLEVVSVVDERGAGFLALGMAKAGKPVALVCTSGTAVANYFPAVMEAFHSHLPLLLLTADRPVELVGTGANQCTDQTKIFASHTRFFVELSCPDASFDTDNHARYAVGKAVALSLQPIPGPVHLNIRFREPFLPDAQTAEIVAKEKVAPKAKWAFLPSASGPSKEQWDAIESTMSSAKRPLILLGAAGFSDSLLSSIFSLSEKTGIPIAAENASGLPLRSGRYGGYITHHLEPILSAMGLGKLEAPDLIIRMGPPLTGKGLGQLFQSQPIPQIIFDQWGEAREPHLHPSVFLQGGIEGWVATILRSTLKPSDESWRSALLEYSEKMESKIASYLEKGALTEWHFHRGLEKKIGESSTIFLGNSMPIRDFNRVFPPSRKQLSVFTNRGLSGIDGLIATAVGVALSCKRETHAVLGDLSTLHDLPSLSLLASFREKINLTIWVMNNGGGEIFKIVPTAKASSKIEMFTTPRAFDLAALAKAFQIPFARIGTRQEWDELDPSACAGPGARFIEIIADRETNTSIRQEFRNE